MSKRLSCPIGFNAQHSPMGAFMSFTCGNPGTKGGIGLQIGQPADQEVFVGVIDGDRYADAPLQSLPFYIGAVSRAAEAFTVEQAGPSEANVRPDAVAFKLEEIERSYGWCTDTWAAGELTFTVYTPFASIPDPAKASARRMREALRPAIVAQIVVDNTKGTKPKTGIFALNHSRTGPHMITDDLGRKTRTGFAFRREAGVAAEVWDVTSKKKTPGPQPFGFMRWSATDGIRERYNPVHLLGSCPGVGIEVPPGRRYAMVLAIGSYLEAPVTTGLDGRYLYTRYYDDLTDVLRSTLDKADELMASAEALDAKLDKAKLSDDQRFMIAHATHSYYGSTQLLEIDRKPFWIVNEGEYCMMNTLDLAVDQVFWELDRYPWLVRNLLDNFVRLYSYTDEVKVYEGDVDLSSHEHDPSQPPPPPDAAQLARPFRTKPGGISFTHDMGAHNNFAPLGRSSYELANLTSTFSYMTVEQLCNWTLTAACYVAKTRDKAWLRKSRKVIQACLASMVNRGGEVGFAQYDSTKTVGGQEITTYDSLDHSLAQTRNNVYMAVKSWATYNALALMFRDLGDKKAQEKCRKLAEKVAGVVAEQAVDGVLPAVFEKGNPGYTSRILPAIEGCMYPLYFVKTGWQRQKLEQVFATPAEKKMHAVLKEHTRRLLLDPQKRNVFADGGIKLSSTSNNSWMSKIAIFMHVSRKVFGLDRDQGVVEVFRKADAAHVTWQVVGSAYWACSDQIVSGVGKASKYYPRIITSALWTD